MTAVDTASSPFGASPPAHAAGPLTRARLRNTGLVYLLLCAAGLGLAMLAGSTGLQAFGLGLIVPGGGFVHFLAGAPLSVTLHALCLVLTLVLFAVSLVLWFGTGNQAAPIVVWLGAAIVAGLMGHEHTLAHSWVPVLGFAGFVVAGGWVLQRRNIARKLARRAQRIASASRWPTVATPLVAGTGAPDVGELSGEDVGALRFALDRALQPVDGFDGFDIIEQFQPSALRYQINNLGYVLSLANYTHLPAMRGYLHQAQRNLIEKKKIPHVWDYWTLESLWGNFRHAPDPIGKDNVMYSGWYATQLGLFEAVTGDLRFDEPGALTLTAKDGTAYPHDFPDLIRTLAQNERDSKFCLFPCEPNWIYPLCNNQAALGIRLYDRIHGTAYWSEMAPLYRRRLEDEFVDLDGHMVLIRSNRTGFTIPGLSSHAEDSILAFWMHPLFPDLSERLWGLARQAMFRETGTGLELLPIKPWLDPGNYRFNTAYALGALGMAARELGDEEAVKAVRTGMEGLETNREGGVVSHPGLSIWSHSFLLKTRVGRANGLADLTNHGPDERWTKGPVIADAQYPEILPARAVSDGDVLEAVLYPGQGSGRFDIGFAQLRPGARYRLDGLTEAEGMADEHGKIRTNVELSGRQEIRLAPLS